MPRYSKAIKDLAEAHKKTMEKAPVFAVWVRRHLRNIDRIDDYEKAYNYVQTGSGLRSANENNNVPSLRSDDGSDAHSDSAGCRAIPEEE